MIKKIDKLVLKTFLGPFFVTFSVVVFIFLLRFILFYFGDIIGKDIELYIIGELLLYVSLITFPIAIPLAILVSSLMCFGKLGEFFELSALKSAGISIIRILVPVFMFTVVIMGFTFWFNNIVLPWANLKTYSLLWDVKSTKTTLNIKEGIFYYDLPGYSIKVGKKYSDQKTLKNLIIYNHLENNGNKRVTLADSGLMYTTMNKKYLVFELFNGIDYVEDVDKSTVSYNYKRTDFASSQFKKTKMMMKMDFDLKKTDESQFKHHQMMKTAKELSDTSKLMVKALDQVKDGLQYSANQYYYYQFREPSDIVKKMKGGKWLDSLLKVKSTRLDLNYVNSTKSLEQARNLVSFSESNIATLASKYEEIQKTDLEWHKKYSLPFSCMVMFLIGGSLGTIVKRGGLGVPVIIAVIFFIIMYLLTTNGDKLAKEGIVNVVTGAWVPYLLLLFCGIYFLQKALTDSQLFEIDIYRMQIEKLKEKLNRNKYFNFISKYFQQKFA